MRAPVLLSVDEAAWALMQCYRARAVPMRNVLPWYYPLRWLAWLIAKATGSPYHHAVIELETQTGMGFVMQAVGQGVIVERREAWQQRAERELAPLRWVRLDGATKLRAVASLSAGYQFSIYLIWFLRYVFPHHALASRAPFYCFELCAFVFGLGGGRWDARRLKGAVGAA